MQILFENGVQVPIELTKSPAQQTILSIYKNLQHVPIPYREWDSPVYLGAISYEKLVDRLVELADKVSVTIDRQLCLDNDQTYFNHIHELYEKGYNGNSDWLDFHEHIHLCELYYINERQPRLTIDYREKSGLLEKKFDISWLSSATTTIHAGDVYVEWAELGKHPYTYWKNNEPDDIRRICELVKPWLKLRPKLQIATADVNRLADKDINGFNLWWSRYSNEWCRHWNVPKWDINDIMACTVIGRINHNTISNLLEQKICPVKVQLT